MAHDISSELRSRSDRQRRALNLGLGGKLISLSLSKAFNYATVGADKKPSSYGTGTVNIRVRHPVPSDTMSAYFDILFPAAQFQKANQVASEGHVVNLDICNLGELL
ncbi:hypothetical protein GUITHDRAFT_144327 [Guillardia theta CCMP2712]|uniref:Uncharacterized protein n=1 Tax=Guillardia theta (strain CCMP2712) TaxID=905079 RepID=L1IQQ8_GUITC|nr:hypothetical protein GUITHDRAFT_144327 [Guillardia theta CCMP2712]EKX38407.1 hypothetical protein GUITHDRAFT_144327 [Guillardia theta CCMP2712]|eukprot:XP_005825387.1 hypothetical protein GUITHDRAFT_144327 [Guillardia theta CCMP2712]